MNRLSLVVAAVLLSGATAALAAPITYVHPSDPTCGGNSPCYSTVALGIQNVDNGGTVIVMASMAGNFLATSGKTGVTLKGSTSAVTLTGGVNVTADIVDGWTVRDLTFTGPFSIKNVATSLSVINVTTTIIGIGPFTQNTTAAILIQGCTLPGGSGALINVTGDPGYDITGSIDVLSNLGVYAVNVMSYVAAGDPANLDSNITVSGNNLTNGANIVVNSTGAIGTGNIGGSVTFANNTMSATTGKLGLTIWGAASGNIAGPITFTSNNGAWLAVLTTDSTVGGSIGSVTAAGNDVEAVEIAAKGAALAGPVLLDANTIHWKGGGTGAQPYAQVDGTPVTGNVTIQGTLGGSALLSTKSTVAAYSGTVQMTTNDAARLVLDSQGGAITQPFTFQGNTLPQATAPDSTLTIRTLAAGSFAGGSITGNTIDALQFDIAGGMTAPLTTSGNVFREAANLINSGTIGGGLNTLTGNDFRGTAYLQGITSQHHFNRHAGTMTVVSGASVDARNNWWGCNAGPGAAGCAALSGVGVPSAPWLTFQQAIRCTTSGDVLVSGDVLSASDGTVPPGNVTPGSVTVGASVGVVTGSPAAMVGGIGTASVLLPIPSVPTLSVQLDSVAVSSTAVCNPDLSAVGVFRPSNGLIYIKNQNTSGFADKQIVFGIPNDKPVAGDWDGNGTQTIGVYRNAIFYLRNSNRTGNADLSIPFGAAGDLPVTGDWNGDGTDTIGLYRNGLFLLRNSNTSGAPDITFSLGIAGDIPIAGDWDNNGTTTVGVFRPSNGLIYLKNTLTTGNADVQIVFGNPNDKPLSGDWDGDGTDTIGVYRNGLFLLRNSNTTGAADLSFALGVSGDVPIAGDWDGPQ